MSQPIFLRIFSGEKLVAVKQFDSTQVIFGKEARVDIDLADPDIILTACSKSNAFKSFIF